MASINILGRDYPLAFTVGAQNELAAHFGSLEAISSIAETGAANNVDAVVYMTAAFMSAAARRGRVRAKILGETYDGPEPLTYDELTAVLDSSDMPAIMKAVGEALTEGNKHTIEIAEKNAEATPASM